VRRFIQVGASLLIAVGGLLAALSPVAAGGRSDVVGHVYVNNNSAGTNTVAGFDRHADGSLTAIAGSPFSAGGAGTGTPTGSAGSLQRSSDGRFLLAADAGSNQVSVLAIHADGSLRLVGSPVSSGGTTPISIAVHNTLVYVANVGAGGSDYTGFRFLGGLLLPIPGSTFSLPNSAAPGEVLFGGTAPGPIADLLGAGLTLIGTRVGPGSGPSFIDSFAVDAFGRLYAAPGSPLPAQRIGPFGSAIRPTNPNQLFVSNAHDGANAGSVSVYRIAADSSLHAITGSPFADNQTAPCWVAITADGATLFAVNTAVPSISGYTIGGNGSLTLQGSTPFNTPTGLRPFDAATDPSGQDLYVVDAGVAKVSAFAISGSSLTEVAGSPFAIPGGAAPFGMVVD
jgi:6-phosphogluconolactonase (cycloisomerase 2 family)